MGYGSHESAILDMETIQPKANRVGFWMFLASETFLFAAFLTTRYVLSGTIKPEHLNQELSLLITMVLLLSSISAYAAEIAISHDDRKGFMRYMSITVLMGLIFMGGVVLEWREGQEFFPLGSLTEGVNYAASFFLLIGLHAFHVVTGLIALLIVMSLAAKGHYGSHDYWAVEGSVKYWHFVDLAWVIIYPTLYLF
jgi:cytochrome c oxidase subunit 3